MTRWLLRLYPKAFRERYGDEVLEMINRSDHPRRDALNVAVHASRLRLQTLITHPLRHLLDVIVVLAVFDLGYTVNDLHGGVSEVHHHWWSSFALAVTALTITARLAVDVIANRRQHPPTDQ
jgi:hypothetical protein